MQEKAEGDRKGDKRERKKTKKADGSSCLMYYGGLQLTDVECAVELHPNPMGKQIIDRE